MKHTSLLLLFLSLTIIAKAQIVVDSNYTVLCKGLESKAAPANFLLADINKLLIKDNKTGKVCMPVSMHFTFIVKGEGLETSDRIKAKELMARLVPKDVIIIDRIKLPADCFIAPRQIKITIE
jgi:hypothetical protein